MLSSRLLFGRVCDRSQISVVEMSLSEMGDIHPRKAHIGLDRLGNESGRRLWTGIICSCSADTTLDQLRTHLGSEHRPAEHAGV